MTILDNELVRKYFGCVKINKNQYCDCLMGSCRESMALRVNEAMQTPIRKGERYISLDGIVEMIAEIDMMESHFYCLRLPDAFQKQEKECDCEELRKLNCSCWVGLHPCKIHWCWHKPTPSQDKWDPLLEEMRKTACDKLGYDYAPHKYAVEEKIESIQNFYNASDPRKDYARKHLTEELRDLVRIAKEEK